MPLMFLAAADMDPMQIAIVVIFLVAGFLKWVWENWQLKREAAKRDEVPPDPEERRLREEAWRRQTGQPAQVPQPTRAAPPAAAPSAWDELRKAWEELKETARSSQPAARPSPAGQPSRPPPMPQSQSAARRGAVRTGLTEAEAKLAAAAAAREAASSRPAQPVVVAATPEMMVRRPDSPFMTALHNLRSDPMLMRQAVVMHEVLGPPKALQSTEASAI